MALCATPRFLLLLIQWLVYRFPPSSEPRNPPKKNRLTKSATEKSGIHTRAAGVRVGNALDGVTEAAVNGCRSRCWRQPEYECRALCRGRGCANILLVSLTVSLARAARARGLLLDTMLTLCVMQWRLGLYHLPRSAQCVVQVQF